MSFRGAGCCMLWDLAPLSFLPLYIQSTIHHPIYFGYIWCHPFSWGCSAGRPFRSSTVLPSNTQSMLTFEVWVLCFFIWMMGLMEASRNNESRFWRDKYSWTYLGALNYAKSEVISNSGATILEIRGITIPKDAGSPIGDMDSINTSLDSRLCFLKTGWKAW